MRAARLWFLLALLFTALFLGLTAFYTTGVLTLPTLLVERWLIGRPQLQFDCVLVQWRNIGAVPASLGIITLLGVFCGLTRYRWRVLPLLLVLALIGASAEVVGKHFIALSLPPVLRSGMVALTCPQVGSSSSSWLRFQLDLGMWWKAPLPARGEQDWAHTVSLMPILLNSGRLEASYSYPSGHALRWWFVGLVGTWLLWRHIRRGFARSLSVIALLIISFCGAATQFYLGAHFISDTIAGYLLGSALACCAIGFLLLNEKPSRSILSARYRIVKPVLESEPEKA
jgi:membrane-associated phospholipid phosphatase